MDLLKNLNNMITAEELLDNIEILYITHERHLTCLMDNKYIVYFDDDKSLRVAHFVSESNNDIQNPAGKFYEAVKKLNQWVKENNINPTSSLQVFLDHYKNETYPGLGSVKKLSLMHHLELIGQFLDGVE